MSLDKPNPRLPRFAVFARLSVLLTAAVLAAAAWPAPASGQPTTAKDAAAGANATPKCLSGQYASATQAAADAAKKEAVMDKDPRAPEKGKFTKDYMQEFDEAKSYLKSVRREYDEGKQDANPQRLAELVKKGDDAEKDLKKARRRLDELGDYNAALEPIYKSRRAADDAVAKLKADWDKEKTDLAAALSKAKADYAAVENDLAAFDKTKNQRKAELKAQATTDLAGAKVGRTQLIADVKAAKDKAIQKLEAIKATLEAYRHCYSEVEDYVTVIKQKIVALGGVASAGLGESDIDDLDKLLDIPLDKPKAPAPPVWVRKAPIFHSDGADRKPENAKMDETLFSSTTAAGKANGLSWSEPPGKITEGDEVALTIQATTNEGGPPVCGHWATTACYERDKAVGDGSAGSFQGWKRGADFNTGKLVFKFKPGLSPTMTVLAQRYDDYGGKMSGTVSWEYVRAKAEDITNQP